MDATDRLTFLNTRQETQCGSVRNTNGYNEGLHVFAFFLIMTCGTTACSFPVVVKTFPRLAISKHALFVSRHFGTGVLIALAFAHLLPTAFENLWDDCLPYFWTEGYDAMPGFIAMLSALTIMLVEMGFTLQGSRHDHSSEAMEARVEGLQLRGRTPSNERNGGSTTRSAMVPVCESDAQCNADLVCPCDNLEEGAKSASLAQTSNGSADRQRVGYSQSESLSSKRKEQRMILQCLLLEAGILFHSVFIGLSISLSTGTTFIALMVAISFHQIFEGLALGARIAEVQKFRISSPKPWAMSFAYGLTCPLGQGIGLGLRKTYNPEGQKALLLVGIANAISAGMIMYAGLVQLLGEDLLSERSLQTLTLRSRMEAVVALLLGCGLMAMIAIWA